MSGFRFESSQKFDALGKWQQPILDIVKRELPGAEVSYVALPMGRVGLFIIWGGFDSLGERRDVFIWEKLALLGANVAQLVTSVHAFTPKEYADLERRGTLNIVVEALQSRLGGDIGYVVFPGGAFNVVAIAPHDSLTATVTFTREYLDRLKGQDAHAIAGILYSAGLFKFLGTAQGPRSITVDVDGLHES
jgi:hypothetical protein